MDCYTSKESHSSKMRKNQEPREVSKALRLFFAMSFGFQNLPGFESSLQSPKSPKRKNLAGTTAYTHTHKSGTPKELHPWCSVASDSL